MAKAQSELQWKQELASTNRDKVVEAFRAEIDKLTANVLTPIPAEHPEFQDAKKLATPGRFILNRKRSGAWKCRGVVRGDLQDRERLDGADFVYYAAASQAMAVRSLIFRGRRRRNWKRGTVDVRAAYTQSMKFDKDEPARYVYFKNPLDHQRMYFRQSTTLYGEASAARRWAETLTGHLRTIGFIPGANDPTVWHNPKTHVSLVIHTDDIYFDGPADGIEIFLTRLGNLIELQEPAYLTNSTPIDFIGIMIAVDDDNTYMSMQPYIRAALEVLQQDFPTLPASSTPFEGSIDETSTELPYAQQKIYRSAVGAIGWMTSVRIDLDFAFSRLSQHLKRPIISHRPISTSVRTFNVEDWSL